LVPPRVKGIKIPLPKREPPSECSKQSNSDSKRVVYLYLGLKVRSTQVAYLLLRLWEIYLCYALPSTHPSPGLDVTYNKFFFFNQSFERKILSVSSILIVCTRERPNYASNILLRYNHDRRIKQSSRKEEFPKSVRRNTCISPLIVAFH